MKVTSMPGDLQTQNVTRERNSKRKMSLGSETAPS
jgi:hypothetical protein